jgi:hypothetical protein
VNGPVTNSAVARRRRRTIAREERAETRSDLRAPGRRVNSSVLAWALAVLLGALSLAAAPDEVAPNENLLADGIPKIPASLAAAVRRYTEARSAGLGGWHPERREILITTRFADTPQIHLVKFPGGARRQLTFFAERVLSPSFQPVRGDYVVFSQDAGGGEFFQYHRLDPATGKVTLLTDGKSRNLGLVWNRQGDRIAYVSTRRNGKDTDLYAQDPADPKTGPPRGGALRRRMGAARLVARRPAHPRSRKGSRSTSPTSGWSKPPPARRPRSRRAAERRPSSGAARGSCPMERRFLRRPTRVRSSSASFGWISRPAGERS